MRERLATIEPTVRGTDLHGALELADGLANPSRMPIREGDQEIDVVEAQPATVYIFSDGRFEDVKGFSLGNLKPTILPIGSLEAKNLAITAFTTRRSECEAGGAAGVRAGGEFYGAAHRRRLWSCNSMAVFSMRKRSKCRPANRRGVVFPLADAPAGKLTARLKYELDASTKQDALAQDDVGYAAVNDAKPGRVLVVSPGNVGAGGCARPPSVRGGWRISKFKKPDVLTSGAIQARCGDRSVRSDHLRSVRTDDDAAANTLFIGRLPPGPAWRRRQRNQSREDEAKSRRRRVQVEGRSTR